MDHIALPTNADYQPVVVPCLSQLEYDHLGFESYPARRGWNMTSLLAGNFTQRHDSSDSASAAAFLQDWLFFGSLREILGEAGSKSAYTLAHIGLKYGRVSTRLLDAHVRERVAYGKALLQSNPADFYTLARKFERVLLLLSQFCSLAICDNEGNDSGRQTTASGIATTTWPLTPEIDLSLRALGSYLSSVLYGELWSAMNGSILPMLRFYGSNSTLVLSRLRRANWCPSDVTRVVQQYSPTSLYYVSILQRSEQGRNHRRCTDFKCYAFQLEPSTYRTKHVDSANDCECTHVGPPMSEVIRTIRDGKVPLLTSRLDRKTGSPRIDVVPYTPGVEYIAVSHVWADGLGNLQENKIPTCQILRLAKMMAELRDRPNTMRLLNTGRFNTLLRKQRGASVRFWMDTLCVPLRQVDGNARDDAIAQMREVYLNAYQVLVLDAELESIDVSDPTKAFMQISLSGWMRRLWTLHEGVLANELHIKFKNTTLDLQRAYMQLMPQIRQPGDNVDCWAGSPVADAGQMYWRMRSLRADPNAKVMRQIFGIRSVLTLADPITVNIYKRMDRIMRAFEAFRFRTTSRTEDIYICIANLLDWKSTNLASEPVQRRMRLLLEQELQVPQGLLFIPGPRSNEPGWGWSVVDFDHESQNKMLAPIGDTTPAPRDALGITVTYPAIVLPTFSGFGTNREIVLSSVSQDSEDQARCWWRLTLLDQACQQHSPQAISVQSQEAICVVYYSQLAREIPSIPMAAAVLAVDQDEQSKLLNPDPTVQILATFIRLAMVEKIGTVDSLDALLDRKDLQLQKITEPAHVLRRHWTVR